MTEAPPGRYRDALRHPDFVRLVIAALIDQVGSWSYSVILVAYVYEHTHSPTWVAVIASSRWMAGVLVSGYAGSIADRYERTKVMLVSATLSGVVMSAIAVAVGLKAPIWTLVPLSVLSSVAAAPYAPATSATLPSVVGEADLAAANAIFATIENLVVVIGPAIGGITLALGSPVDGVAANAGTFLVVVALLLGLKARSRGEIAEGMSMVREWVSGFEVLVREHEAFAIVVFCALDSAVYGASMVIFAPLSVRLGTGVNGYSYLLAGTALGGVIAAGLANKLSAGIRLAPVIGISIVVQAAPFAATAATHTPAVAFVLQVLSGVGMVIVDVLAMTALQRRVPNELLGRVMAAFLATVSLSIMAASLVMSGVVSAFGVVASLIVTGVAVPLLAALAYPLLLRADRLSAGRAIMIRERVAMFEGLDLFEGTSSTTLEQLAAAAEQVELPARSLLIKEGDRADALWVLVSGALTVRSTSGSGTARQLPPVQAPGYVGEVGLVNNVPRTATVRTSQPSRLLRIDGDVFLDALSSLGASHSLTQLTGVRWQRTAARSLGSAARSTGAKGPAVTRS